MKVKSTNLVTTVTRVLNGLDGKSHTPQRKQISPGMPWLKHKHRERASEPSDGAESEVLKLSSQEAIPMLL